MSDERDLIRTRIDIVDMVGQRVSLKRSGKNFVGLCPFHDDKSPSFYVMPDSGRYKCFACGAAGDAFTWVMNDQNVEFVDALKILAAKAGVELKQRNPEAASERARQVSAMMAAQQFFVERLSKADVALKYLEGRGIDAAVREAWGIGFSPTDDHALATLLRQKKFELAEARKLFLVEDDGSGGYYDKFKGRVMFPIHDDRGDLVAFGGRVIGDAHPKYINSGDTPLYRKSRVLYGLHRAKQAMAKTRVGVVVEGYLDVIACHRAGVETAVASLGTSLAEDQAKLLKRWCDSVVILYDSDAAGERAAARACEILQAEGLKVKVALMPAGEDPDTLLRTAGPGAVQRAAEGGLSPLAFSLAQIEGKLDPKGEEFWREVVAALAKSPSPVEIESEVARLAQKHLPSSPELKIKEIHAELNRLRRDARGARRSRYVGIPDAGPTGPHELLPTERLLVRAFVEDDLRGEALSAMRELAFMTDWGQAVKDAIVMTFTKAAPSGKPIEWLSRIEDEAIREFLAEVKVDHSDSSRAGLIKFAHPVTREQLFTASAQLRNLAMQPVIRSLMEQPSGEDDIARFHEMMKEKFERERFIREGS